MPDQAASTHPEILVIEDDLDIFAISLWWDRMLGFCRAAKADPVLDISRVSDLDLCGMQALLALERDCKARGVRLVLLGLRNEHRDRMKALGFPEFTTKSEISQ